MIHQDVILLPNYLTKGRADALLHAITANTNALDWETLKHRGDLVPDSDFFTQVKWEQRKVFVYGKWHLTPRLTAWQAAPGIQYRYSGQTHEGAPMNTAIYELAEMLKADWQTPFNSVLLNWYRSGQDAMGWHADDEPELGKQPTIASISLGATRKFALKHKTNPLLKSSYELTHGSLLMMKGNLQHEWIHALPRTNKVKTGRINLTFRNIITHK
jgi:alkylated DNA repair dioxygenase AlkB